MWDANSAYRLDSIALVVAVPVLVAVVCINRMVIHKKLWERRIFVAAMSISCVASLSSWVIAILVIYSFVDGAELRHLVASEVLIIPYVLFGFTLAMLLDIRQ